MFFRTQSQWLFGLQLLLGVSVAVGIVGSDMTPECKLAWIIPIILLPMPGAVF